MPVFPRDGGEMGALIRAHDWSRSPLGAPATWNATLCANVQLLLESRIPMFIAWGPERALLYNDAYAVILGSKHPAALGARFYDVWTEIWPDIAPLIDAALAGNATYSEDLPLLMNRRGFDEQTWFTFSYSPLRDEDGKVRGMFCACIETTGKFIAQQTQRDAEALSRLQADELAAIFDAAPVGLAVFNRELQYVRINQRLAAMNGVSIADHIGRSVREIVPDISDQAVGIMQRVLAGEPQWNVEFSGTTPAHPGVVGTWRENWLPFRDAEGEIIGITVSVEDISKDKAAAEALRQSEERLRELNETLEKRVADALADQRQVLQLLDSTSTFVQLVDLDFNWLAINRANADEFERIFGVRPKPGDNMLALLADRPAERAEVEAVWRRALSGEEFTVIAPFGDPQRDRRFYEIRFNSLRGDDGTLRGAYQFAYDVTERVRDQERLAEAQEALRQSQKMESLGQLTGGVAHDFNNLLLPIIGGLDMLQRRGLPDQRAQRIVDNALTSAERARTLVQRLLAFARRQPLQPTAVDVADLIHGMADLVASTSGPNVKVEVHLAPDLPPAHADPNQLEMAVLNLSVNARDAMPDGGRLTITAGTAEVGPDQPVQLKPGGYVRICVADTGIGMDETTLARAVEPFFRPRASAKAPASACRWYMGSRRSWAVRCASAARRASEPRSSSGCRRPSSRCAAAKRPNRFHGAAIAASRC